jgi:hypothetical protein
VKILNRYNESILFFSLIKEYPSTKTPFHTTLTPIFQYMKHQTPMIIIVLYGFLIPLKHQFTALFFIKRTFIIIFKQVLQRALTRSSKHCYIGKLITTCHIYSSFESLQHPNLTYIEMTPDTEKIPKNRVIMLLNKVIRNLIVKYH